MACAGRTEAPLVVFVNAPARSARRHAALAAATLPLLQALSRAGRQVSSPKPSAASHVSRAVGTVESLQGVRFEVVEAIRQAQPHCLTKTALNLPNKRTVSAAPSLSWCRHMAGDGGVCAPAVLLGQMGGASGACLPCGPCTATSD